MTLKQRQKPGPKTEIGNLARQLIIQGELSDDAIVDRVKQTYSGSRITRSNVHWYRWDLKKKGEIG